MPRILLVEDEEAHSELITRAFDDRPDFHLAVARSLSSARTMIEEAPPDLAIVDLLLPDGRGIELFPADSEPSFPAVMMTSHGDEQVAVEVMKAGVLDYVVKSETSFLELPRTAERALREWGYIEDRRRVEKALLESEEHFRSLIENALDVITVLDHGDVIEYANPAVRQALDYRPEEMVGEPIRDYVHPEDRASLEKALTKAKEQPGSVHSCEFRARHRDGSWRSLESLCSTHPPVAGQPRCVVNSRDTTFRRVAQEALRESEQRHRDLVEGVPIGIFELDEEGRLLAVNRAGKDILRLGEWPGVHGSLLDVVVDGERASVAGRIEQALEGRAGEFEFSTEIEGQMKYLASGLVPLEDRGDRKAKIIGHVVDVTERRLAGQEREALEQQLRQSQKMEALGQLAAGVAHDFNNVLTVIAGHTTFLDMAGTPGGPHCEHVEAIRSALERATSLSRQLLAFGRRQVMRPQVLDLNKAVSGVQGMLRRLIGEHIRLSVEAGEGVGRIVADPTQIEQVLMNLAVNARDAMPNGGRVTVRTESLTSEEPLSLGDVSLPAGSFAVLIVEDNGAGMDEATKSQVFEPFFTTKPRGKGTGLGLSTVYGIVKQSGGQIDVETESGRGCRFRIYLPTVDENLASPSVERPAQEPRRGTETILVVEDDDAMRRLIGQVLSALGYRVMLAADGAEGLRVIEASDSRIDLLLTDLVMPGLNGRQLAERFRERLDAGEVLYISGYAADAFGPQVTLDVSENFLEKPFSPGTLGRRVREVLDGVRELAPAAETC